MTIQESNTGHPFTPARIREWASSKKGRQVGNSWHEGFLKRHKDAVKQHSMKPQEYPRTMISPQAIQSYKNRVTRILENQPAKFIYQVDESGYHACEDSPAMVIVSTVDDSEKKTYAIDRSERRFTLEAYIRLDGTSILPYFVVKGKVNEIILLNEGAEQGNHCEVVTREQSAYLTGDFIVDWIDRVLLHDIRQKRQAANTPDQTAFLIMDGCRVHQTEAVRRMMRKNNIKPIYLVPHATHLMQPLDLVVFAPWKRYIRQFRGTRQRRSQEQLIAMAASAYEKGTCPLTIFAAFAAGGYGRSCTEHGAFCQILPDRFDEMANKARDGPVGVIKELAEEEDEIDGIILDFESGSESEEWRL